MKKLISIAIAVLLIGAIASFAYVSLKPKTTIAVVVKVGDIPWFNAMEEGIKQRGKELGVNAFMIGPATPEPGLQIKAIEDLIEQRVDVIGVVPNNAQMLEPVLQKARAVGIKVITHESTAAINKDYNFELVSGKDLGAANGKLLAESTNCEGSYAVYVGSLTVPAHNAWADSAIDYLKDACPNMKKVSRRYGVAESSEDSYNKTMQLAKDHSQLSGIIAFGSQGPIGAAQAVEKLGMIGKISVVGSFSAVQGKELVHSGALTGGYIWNPTDAGQAFVELGNKLVQGETIDNGDNIEVLGSVVLDDNNIFANIPMEYNKNNVDALAAQGL